MIRERQPLGIATEVNVVCALDFMRDTLYDGRPFRTLNMIDESNREALRIESGTPIPSACLLRNMNQLIEAYGVPKVIRVDNGPEMTSEAFIELAKEMGIELLFIQPGKLNQKRFLKSSTETTGMKCSMPICLIQSQRLKKPLMFGWQTTTISDLMSPLVIKLP